MEDAEYSLKKSQNQGQVRKEEIVKLQQMALGRTLKFLSPLNQLVLKLTSSRQPSHNLAQSKYD